MCRIMEAEDRISEVEEKLVEINEAERKKEKRIKRNEDRDPTGSARWSCRGKRHATPGERPPEPLAAWAARRREKRCTAPGRTRASLWLPEPLRPGKTQHAGATESALLWRTRKLEPHSTRGPVHIEQPGA